MLEVRSIETTMLEEDGSRAEACFVETERGALFMVTHLPAGPAQGAVVVCSPIQSELLKNNRHEVMLARRLASQGVAVARFHYIGTGNSDGEVGDVTIDGMAADTARGRHRPCRRHRSNRVRRHQARLAGCVLRRIWATRFPPRLLGAGGLGSRLPQGVDAGQADGRDATRDRRERGTTR